MNEIGGGNNAMSSDSTTPRMPDLDKDEIKDIDKRLTDIGFGKYINTIHAVQFDNTYKM